MLNITIDQGEKITIGNDIWIRLGRKKGRKQFQITIEAPKDLKILREKLRKKDEQTIRS